MNNTDIKLVSVVIPVYNEEASLPALLSRVTAACDQLSQDYEVILIDDGSHDGSAAVCDALAQEDAGLSVKALEQLGNLEVRHAIALFEQKQADAGKALLASGEQRLRAVLALQATSERHNLLASMYKRIGQVQHTLQNDASTQAALGHPDWLERMAWRLVRWMHRRRSMP